MDAAFHERDTHVTAKCNVCFKGVNAAEGTRRFDYGDRRNGERSQKAAESATRTERSKRQGGEAASDRAERPGADGSSQTEWQAPDAKRQTADNDWQNREIGSERQTTSST